MIKENYHSSETSGISDHIIIDEGLLKYYSDNEINENSFLSKSYSLQKNIKNLLTLKTFRNFTGSSVYL